MDLLLSSEEESVTMKILEFLNKDVDSISYNDIQELQRIRKQSRGETEKRYGSHFVMCEGPYIEHYGPVVVNTGNVKDHLDKIAEISKRTRVYFNELECMHKESKFYYHDIKRPAGELAFQSLRLYDVSMELCRILTIGSMLHCDWKRKQESYPDYQDVDEKRVIEEIRQLGVTFRYPKVADQR